MNTNETPSAAAGEARLESVVEGILSGLREQDLSVVAVEDKAISAGSLSGRSVCFRIGGMTADSVAPGGGTVFLTFSYLRENDLGAALAPDLSIGNRYHPARLAKRIGAPVPKIFDLTALALQQNYFRVVTDEDRLPPEVTDCRLLFARGNWHAQVQNLTQSVVADLKWVPTA
jgi:hypothetical protein